MDLQVATWVIYYTHPNCSNSHIGQKESITSRSVDMDFISLLLLDLNADKHHIRT